MTALRYLSVCSGIEAATQAWHPLGWQPAAFSEIEPFPCAVLAHHYPHVPNFGDMTKFEDWPDDAIDLLCGGTPCFPAGTMIATDAGFIPIENVSVGDMVLTHHGRFRRVMRIGNKIAPTIKVTGHGHFGMVTTANHPFWARRKIGKSTRVDGKPVRLSKVTEPGWVRAGNLRHYHWGCVSAWPSMPVPEVMVFGREKPVNISAEALMTLAGAYLGDGWARETDRRGYVFLGINPDKLEMLRPVLDRLRTYTVTSMRTSVRVQISSRPLARWMRENFGSGAVDKRVPMWALGASMPLRDALIRGYQITDGGPTQTTGIRATTVSRQLALTMRALAVSCGVASSVGYQKRQARHAIDGRAVNQRDTYTVTFSPSDRSSFEDGGFRWQLVRNVAPTGREERVFNIEVEEDHSYVADGIAVHNCQSFSVAGMRKGLADPRGNLMLTFGAIAGRYRPRWLVWENVPGVLSSNGGRDFGAFLGMLGELGYGFAYRVLDAQHVRTRRFPFAVPQRRRRVFVVGYLGDWRRAAAVLFDRESLSGHPAPRREAGQIAPTIPARSLGGGGLGTDFDCDGGLICANSGDVGYCLTASAQNSLDAETETLIAVAHALRGEGFDASEDGTGRGTPLVPVAIQERAICENQNAGPDGAGFRQDGASYTLEARTVPQAVAFDMRGRDGGAMPEGPHDTANIRAASGGSSRSYVAHPYAVRRLTPRECERLMAFPDDFTRIPYRGKPADACPDGPRYKALGNSWAVNCAEWIGERIAEVDTWQ